MEGPKVLREVLVAVAVAAVSLLASPLAAGASTPPVVHVSERFTTTAPGTPTGQSFAMTIDAAGDPTAKPPALLRETLQLPPGARFDPSAIAQCDDTNQALLAAELMAGQKPCPAAFLGVDHATMDTGNTAAPSQRFILADVDEYNARGSSGDEVVFVAKDPGSGLPTTIFYGTVSSDTLDVKVPFVPGSPPDGQASDRGEHQDLPVTGGYRVTPPTCPPSGRWVSTSTFYFKDGATDTAGTLVEVVQSSTPCVVAATQAAPVTPEAGGTAPAPLTPEGAAIAVPNTGATPATGATASTAAAVLLAAAALRRRRRTRWPFPRRP
jgi:MYXO-CTERM domain-containing protein